MPECSECGAWVSKTFLRVLDDPDGCRRCSSWSELFGVQDARSSVPVEPRARPGVGTEPALSWSLDTEDSPQGGDDP